MLRPSAPGGSEQGTRPGRWPPRCPLPAAMPTRMPGQASHPGRSPRGSRPHGCAPTRRRASWRRCPRPLRLSARSRGANVRGSAPTPCARPRLTLSSVAAGHPGTAPVSGFSRSPPERPGRIAAVRPTSTGPSSTPQQGGDFVPARRRRGPEVLGPALARGVDPRRRRGRNRPDPRARHSPCESGAATCPGSQRRWLPAAVRRRHSRRHQRRAPRRGARAVKFWAGVPNGVFRAERTCRSPLGPPADWRHGLPRHYAAACLRATSRFFARDVGTDATGSKMPCSGGRRFRLLLSEDGDLSIRQGSCLLQDPRRQQEQVLKTIALRGKHNHADSSVRESLLGLQVLISSPGIPEPTLQ